MSLRKSLTTSGKLFSADKTEDITPQSPTIETPDSPAVKVKRRETKYNPDPLFYHPSCHPNELIRRKSQEAAKKTKLNGVTDPMVKDDLTASDTSESEFKSPAPKLK